MTDADRERLLAVFEALSAPMAHEADRGMGDNEDIYAERLFADDSLAGLIQSVLSGGNVDRIALRAAKSLHDQYGSHISQGLLGDAYGILARAR